MLNETTRIVHMDIFVWAAPSGYFSIMKQNGEVQSAEPHKIIGKKVCCSYHLNIFRPSCGLLQ